MVGFYEPRTTNNGLSLGFRCGIAPRQIHEMNAVRRWPVAVRKKKRPPIGAFFTSRGLLKAACGAVGFPLDELEEKKLDKACLNL